MKSLSKHSTWAVLVICLFLTIYVGVTRSQNATSQNTKTVSNGPAQAISSDPRQGGSATAGRDVFRFETFGNEGFWTDAVRLPAGVLAAKVTPLKAPQLGLMVDVDAVLTKKFCHPTTCDVSPAQICDLNGSLLVWRAYSDKKLERFRESGRTATSTF